MTATRIAVQAGAPLPGRDWIGTARRYEELGYDTLLMPDHAAGGGLSPMVALAAAAAATTRLRVGQLVVANDFRSPLILAREALTLDELSGGRAELGLGAGWSTRDYESLGLPYDAPAVRVERLAESVRLIKRLLTEDDVTFEGRYYRMHRAQARPKRATPPRILVAGGGDRILTLAAREADIVAPIPRTDRKGAVVRTELAAEALERKLDLIRLRAGARYAALELQLLIFTTVVTDDRAKAVREVAERFGVDDGLVAGSPWLAFGTAAEIADQLRRTRDRYGIRYFCVRGEHVEALAPALRAVAES